MVRFSIKIPRKPYIPRTLGKPKIEPICCKIPKDFVKSWIIICWLHEYFGESQKKIVIFMSSFFILVNQSFVKISNLLKNSKFLYLLTIYPEIPGNYKYACFVIITNFESLVWKKLLIKTTPNVFWRLPKAFKMCIFLS